MRKSEVIVVGAGIIGVTTALALQARDLRVTLLDRGGVAAETSAGNAGAFAFAEVLPLASPGILRQAPRWLLDPLGPLAVPPRYALRILPWMLRFWRASWRDRVEASTRAQAALMRHCETCLQRLAVDTGAERLLRHEGQLALYESGRELAEAEAGWALRRKHGVEFERLDGPAALAEIQPGLSPRFTTGMFTPGWINTTDPAEFTRYLAQVFLDRGGRFETQAVRALSTESDAAVLHLGDGSTRRTPHAVICAGAWSHRLARTLGERIPLETERGYNTTLPAGAFDLRTHLTFGGHGFVVSRIGDGIRVGGAVELGGLRLPPNYRRADVMLDKAKTFLPELNTEGGTRWMGFRPSLPDSLPVIGPSPRAPQVVYAFGHGHLGLTQSVGTADLVADIVSARSPAIELAPFRADRFTRFP